MLENEALLRAILANPDDDGIRLIYADWCEEHGQPERAEFIRLQIDLARTARTDPRRQEWQHREKELLDRRAWEWAVPLGENVVEWAFRRGFIERIQTYLQHPPEALRARLQLAPLRHLREVSGYCFGGDNFYELDKLLAVLPDLQNLSGLELWGIYYTGDDLVRALLSSPHLARLRTLILALDQESSAPIADEVLVEGLASPHRANLRSLGVNFNGMQMGPSERVIRGMIASPHLKRLRKLNLSNARLTAERLTDLFRALPHLNRLNLTGVHAPEEVWELLLERARTGKLGWLCLGGAALTETGHTVPLSRIWRYRDGFQEAPVRVGWWERTFDSWRGHSWEGRRQLHLFAMNRYLQRGDYDGLEAAYQADCMRYAGVEVTAAVTALPFEPYETDLHAGMRWAMAEAEKLDGKMIALRLQSHANWRSEFQIGATLPSNSTEPRTSFGRHDAQASFPGPEFPAAGELFLNARRSSPLDPDAIQHYLWARTLAAFGRCVRQYRSPVPVLFDCTYAVFRLPERSGQGDNSMGGNEPV